MSDWLRTRDEDGFCALLDLQRAYARNLIPADGLAGVRVVQFLVEGGAGEDELAFKRTIDSERAYATPEATRYLGRLALLSKRPGNPFPHMVTIGRAQNSDLVVTSGSISKVHAYFLRQGDGWALVDQRSHNGTFVDGRRLQAAAPQALHAGARIGLGEHVVLEYLVGAQLADVLEAGGA